MLEIIIYAMLAGIGASISLSILGNFVLWKKMSYIGDSIAHNSILGVAVSLVFGGLPLLWVILICFIFSCLFVILNKKYKISQDSILVVNTQLSLSLGIIIIALVTKSNIGLNNYFLGNILSINHEDLFIIYTIAVFVVVYMIFNWNKILLITINEEIAQSEGINIFKHDLILVFMISSVVASSIKFLGFLLIPSLLIIPAIIANKLSASPLKTIIFTILIGGLANIIGIFLATIIDVSTAPLITLVLIVMLLIKLFLNTTINKLKV